MRTEKVKKGARFLAKWPGTQYYYWCTLNEQVGDKWKVEFADGTLAEVFESDLHESLPEEALNIVGRVTRSSPKKQGMDRSPTKQVMRSSPTKQRKRPEETRRSPSRKVRKLFTDEYNVKLGAELNVVIETAAASGTEVAHPPPSTERSVNVPEETEEFQQGGNSCDSCDDSGDSGERSRSATIELEDSSDSTASSEITNSSASVGRPSHERSVSVSRETSDVTQRALGVESSPFRKTGSVTRESKDFMRGASGDQSSPFIKTGSVTREIMDVAHAASNVRSSPYRRSVSITKDAGSAPHAASNVRSSPYRRSVSITKDAGSAPHGAADSRPSPLKSSYAVDVQKESVTRSVTKYTESYLDRDVRRRLLIEGPIGSSDLRYSPFRSDSPFHERRTVTPDLETSTGSYLDRDFRSQPLKEYTVGSAELRPSSSRISMLNERTKMISDLRNRSEPQMDSNARKQFGREGSVELKKYAESYLNRDLQRELGKEGSFDLKTYTDSLLGRDFRKQLGRETTVGSSHVVQSSPYRRSLSLAKDNPHLMSGKFSTRCSLKDYEKKHLKKYPMEFGGIFGALLMIFLLPFYVMSIHVFNLVPDPTKFEVLTKFEAWLQRQLIVIPTVAFAVLVILLMQAVLTIVPIGTVASGPLTKLGILNMRCNGIYAFVLTLVVTISACYYQRAVADIVITVFNEAAVSAMFLGIILALILYKRADKLPVSYLNPYGCTGYKLYDFWMGREMTPRIGKFNIKQILHRFSIIIVITLNVLIVAKAYFQGEEEDLLKSLMMETIMQSLYCLHFLIHEDIYLYSFLAVSEGVGYMIAVGFVTFPFMLTLTTKLILEYRLKATLTEICIAVCAYTVGHLLLELSSQKKTLSVRDPVTSVWKMKVPEWNSKIHTTGYLGEILTYWSFTVVAGTTYPGLFIVPAALTVGVLSRAFREYTRAAYQGGEVNNKQ